MPREKQFDSAAERQKAYRERKAQDVDPELPVRDLDEAEPAPGTRSIEAILALDPFAPLADSEEQSLRDHFGYTSSERRTRAEREATAQRIKSKLGTPSVELPPDIKKIWKSPQDQLTAKTLIEAWSVEGFRGSALHLMALGEIERAKKEQAYLDTRKVPAP